MIEKAIRLTLTLAFLCSTTFAQMTPAKSAETPLTNDDVVALVKAGLGDDVVVAKIRQSRNRALDLSADGLIKLKKAGVSQKVITVMLGGDSTTGMTASGPSSQQQTVAPMPAMPGTPWGPFGEVRPDSIEMLTSQGSARIDRVVGRKSTTNIVVGMLLWCNVADPRAEQRTRDSQPSFRLHAQHRPSETYKLVKAESNEKDRSVKLESINPFAFRGNLDFGVDEDWIIPVNETQVEPGLWVITPRQPLKPGEYGVIAGLEYFYGFGVESDGRTQKDQSTTQSKRFRFGRSNKNQGNRLN